MEITEWTKNDYVISTDKLRIDVSVVHRFLAQSYWAEKIPIEIVKRAIDNSLCFAMYRHSALVGFARVISDFATFAYLADVFILPEERGRGLSKWLMQTIIDHPELHSGDLPWPQETRMIYMLNLDSLHLTHPSAGCTGTTPMSIGILSQQGMKNDEVSTSTFAARYSQKSPSFLGELGAQVFQP